MPISPTTTPTPTTTNQDSGPRGPDNLGEAGGKGDGQDFFAVSPVAAPCNWISTFCSRLS